jgi:hypothetical protein
VENYCRAGQATDDNMAHAHYMWVPKATYTHSEYVTFIALARQQWSHDRALFLGYTYIACPVYFRLSSLGVSHCCY